ncbi:MAG: sensor histidine kinase [Candidatus Promineifilaceae bacterium]
MPALPDRFRSWLDQRLTYRQRVALWLVGTAVLFGLGLLLFINLTVTLSMPPTMMVELAPVEGPVDLTAPAPSVRSPVVGSSTAGGQTNNLALLRAVSLVGLGLLVLAAGLSAYWLAGQVLRPIRKLNQAVSRIDANSLDSRLSLKAPADELRQLSEAFNAMLARVEEAFAQQGNFVADAAHELRTPLATLRTNLEVVQADPAADLEAFQAMSATLEGNLARLEQLVADLLLLSQGQQQLVRENTFPSTLIEDVFDELAQLAAERQVSLELGGATDVSVLADESLLRRALLNLVENGIRYNRPGGRVDVDLGRDDGWVVIAVSDTGPGIPPEEQGRVFDRFYRLDRSRARHLGGAGLGLSIAAHIVHLHDGDVRVARSSASGTTFVLRLPA